MPFPVPPEPPDDGDIHRAALRVIVAATAVRALSDSGVLFEGYDGAEPQRTTACAALDELGASLDALATISHRPHPGVSP